MKNQRILGFILTIIFLTNAYHQSNAVQSPFISFISQCKDYSASFVQNPNNVKYLLIGTIGLTIAGYCGWSKYSTSVWPWQNYTTKKLPNHNNLTVFDYVDKTSKNTIIHFDDKEQRPRYMLLELEVPNQFQNPTQGGNSCAYQALKNGIVGARLFEPDLFKNNRTFTYLEKKETEELETSNTDDAAVTNMLLFSQGAADYLFKLPINKGINKNKGGEWRLKVIYALRENICSTLDTADYKTKDEMIAAYANLAGVNATDLKKGENIDIHVATKILEILEPLENIAFLIAGRTYEADKLNTNRLKPTIMISQVHPQKGDTTSNKYANSFEQARKFLDEGITLITLLCLKQPPTQDIPDPSGYIVALVANKNDKSAAACPYKFLFLDSHDGINHPERVKDSLVDDVIKELIGQEEQDSDNEQEESSDEEQ